MQREFDITLPSVAHNQKKKIIILGGCFKPGKRPYPEIPFPFGFVS